MNTMSSNHQIKPSLTKGAMLIALVTGLLLLVPLVAMQFTNEVVWTLFDFVVAGALLMSTGLLYLLAARKLTTPKSRAIAGAAIGLAFLTIWAELAVGIFH